MTVAARLRSDSHGLVTLGTTTLLTSPARAILCITKYFAFYHLDAESASACASGGSHEQIVATHPRGNRDGPHFGEQHGLVRAPFWRACPASTPTSRLPCCLLRSALLPASYSLGSSWVSRAVAALIACRFRALRGGAPQAAFCSPGSLSSARPFEGRACGESSWCLVRPSPSRARFALLVRWPWRDGLKGENSPAPAGIRPRQGTPNDCATLGRCRRAQQSARTRRWGAPHRDQLPARATAR